MSGVTPRPEQCSIRFRVDPGDVPALKAARRLHLTLAEFEAKLPALLQRGFPAADETTGMFCLEAIDQWRLSRFPRLFRLTAEQGPQQSREIARARIARM
jgi:hypothetical protein